jgi:hypothetical protein
MSDQKYPSVQVAEIPVTSRHLAAFGATHALEAVVLLVSPNRGIDALQIQETYVLTEQSLGTVNINVTGIRARLAARAIPFAMLRCQLTEEWYRYTYDSCGCEEDHIARLTPSDLERPGIMINWDSERHHTTLVDGSHRLCRRWRDGLKTFEFAYVNREHVEEFVKKVKEP